VNGDRQPRAMASATSGLLILAILAFPILAHGCHREDVDNEPGFIPLPHHLKAELPR
jgi:hypothetical protein